MAIADGVIIILCILGAGFAVLIGFAIFRYYGDKGGGNFNQRSNEQSAYMRDVRERNKAINHFESRFAPVQYGGPKGGASTYTATASNAY